MKRLLAAGLTAAALTTLAACGGEQSQEQPPPPPAKFGQQIDWGNGNRVVVESPTTSVLPGDLKSMIVLVRVHNGAQNAVPANQYRAEVKVDNNPTTTAVFGVANLPQGQVQSNSDAQFPVVFEAPVPGAKLDVTVTGPNEVPAVTYEGAAPAQ